MKNSEAKKIAEEISLKLLATKNHVDFEWLVNKLSELKIENEVKKRIPPCVGHSFEEDVYYSDCGDAFEY